MRIKRRGYRRREGISIIENIILMVVLMLVIGALFSTMSWTTRSSITSRQDRDSRELLFAWVQTFESLWPPKDTDWSDPAALYDDAMECIEQTAITIGGTWNGNDGNAAIGGFTVVAAPNTTIEHGSMNIGIGIFGDNKDRPYVSLDRRYNIYTTETVSDDSVVGG